MYKVLIADDEAKVCGLIYGLVDWAELQLTVVKIVHDGIAARQAIDEMRPDIVITDIRMPGVTGLDLIRDAKAQYPDMDFVIVSGYRHFDYAHTAIKYGVEDYLLKPLRKQEFLGTLQKLIEKKRDAEHRMDETEALRKRAQPDLSHLHAELLALWRAPAQGNPPCDLALVNEMYRVHLAPGVFLALCIQADIGWTDDEVPFRNVLSEKLVRIARERLLPVSYEVITAALPGGAYGMVNCSPDALSDVRRALNIVVEERVLLRDLCPALRVTIGVGGAIDDVTALPEGMRKASDAVAERLVQGTDRVLSYAKAEMPPLSKALSQELKRSFIAALETLDTDAYARCLHIFFSNLDDIPNLSALYVRRCFLELSSLSQYTLRQVTGDAEELSPLQETCAHRLERCASLSEANAMLTALLTEALKTAADARKAADTRPIRQAKQIMRAHYQEPLTLEYISQQVGFHPVYFSSLFKKVTGENFLESLCAIRMEEAKQLLMDGSLGVADVAERVGYNDVKHFTKLFKKTMGLTPNEYRKLYY